MGLKAKRMLIHLTRSPSLLSNHEAWSMVTSLIGVSLGILFGWNLTNNANELRNFTREYETCTFGHQTTSETLATDKRHWSCFVCVFFVFFLPWNSLPSWWLVPQPIWKMWSSKWIISPNRGENKTYLKVHHLVAGFRGPDPSRWLHRCWTRSFRSSARFLLKAKSIASPSSGINVFQDFHGLNMLHWTTVDGSEIPNDHLGCIKPRK